MSEGGDTDPISRNGTAPGASTGPSSGPPVAGEGRPGAVPGTPRSARTRPPRVLEPTVHGTVRPGSRIGSKRVVLPRGRSLLRMIAPGHWLATPAADNVERGRFDRARRFLFGARLSSASESEERLDKKRALAVFASDALSSTAYATEEILLVLVLAGTLYLDVALPLAIAIALLLLVVSLSYRQTVFAYPNGGGAYAVASDNFGIGPALVAGASLLTDYVLTVAVSISAGSLAIVSAIPALAGYELHIALGGLVVVTAINLRGVRESGSIFSVLTYIFLGSFALMVVLGVARLVFGGLDGASLMRSAPPTESIVPVSAFGVFLVLRAFSSGATALTGLESIANGIQAFRPPESKNAAATMMLMSAILAFFFIGATFLAVRLGIVPEEGNSVISQIASDVFGHNNPLYFILQGATAMVLVLAANTAFNGFPRLSALMAKDGYMPRRFGFQDDRLTFSAGIIVLALISGGLLLLFKADTHRLIPLYAIGVFLSFTISQSGMVVRWRRLGGANRRAMAINTIGGIATGVVTVVIATTKFTHGAWMVMVLIPGLVILLRSIHRHYRRTYGLIRIREDEAVELVARPAEVGHMPMLIPVRRIDRLVVFAVEYARAMSDNVTAVHVRREGEDPAEEFVSRWERMFPDVPIVVVESPYRTFLGPFLSYVDSVLPEDGSIMTIVVPEFEIVHWWERVLHNSTARLIGRAAAKRPRVIVTSASARPGWMP